ncbi:MAG: hypothetical protein MUC96_34560, partial [Myxococcaceae bacterium]|nr:hypothetical protein [Myxococcaceae bacterium]
MEWWDLVGLFADVIGIVGAVVSVRLWFKTQSLELRLERAVRLPGFIEKVGSLRNAFHENLDARNVAGQMQV